MTNTHTDPDQTASSANPAFEDAFIVGDEMLARAKKVAREIDDRIRKLTERARQITDETASGAALDDSTDEQPPLAS